MSRMHPIMDRTTHPTRHIGFRTWMLRAGTFRIWTLALLALTVVTTGTIFAANTAPTPSPRIQSRIDSLLKRRTRPDALPIDPPNPFEMPNGRIREFSSDPAANRGPGPNTVASAAGAGNTPNQASAADDPSGAEALATAAGKLKIGGVIILKDQTHLVINGVPRREGDMIPADWNNTLIYLRVVRLLPTQVVLRYRDSEWTYKLETRR